MNNELVIRQEIIDKRIKEVYEKLIDIEVKNFELAGLGRKQEITELRNRIEILEKMKSTLPTKIEK